MPRPIAKVIILGSSALKIGEAGEFDYSGSQAIKALRDEGIRTVLVNPNIATIQTSEYLADEIYFLPVTPSYIEQIIAKEKPGGILLGFGGQTALNCGLELERLGVFAKHNVSVLGTPVEAIRNTEDRQLFAENLQQAGAKYARSIAVSSLSEAAAAAKEIGFPVMLRVGFALGGLGSSVCWDENSLESLARKALAHSPQVLIEEYLAGWKEVEYEVVRDSADNCVTVCNMENVDPMGIHTGESIVVAPSQTLTDREYHQLREVSIRVVRHFGIVGECNVQFALNPKTSDYRIIEINARLSRSSALASKATGYPLAYIAAKLALGYTLPELDNPVTKVTKACFEPALDYLVVKIPRWDFDKFQGVEKKIGSVMKSVGEIMAIGRNFEEALQKGLRMLEIGVSGLVGNSQFKFEDLPAELRDPTHRRIFAVAEAMLQGMPVEEAASLTNIDKWFLYKVQHIAQLFHDTQNNPQSIQSPDFLRRLKRYGFSDAQIAAAAKTTETQVREARLTHRIAPCVKQIDTLAAEYPAQTNYLYLSYDAAENDVSPEEPGRCVIVLGSGAYRIGSSVEFDWCGVNAIRTLTQLGFRTIMINCNPETVSTDYNECDKLYFEELTFETVREIYEREQPRGIILSMGGQIPNNLALRCAEAGMKILGTAAEDIDRAEDRHKFSSMLESLGVDQPEWKELTSLAEAKAFAASAGYPVIVRPSYVLSGAAMRVALNDSELEQFLTQAAMVNENHTVVISKFIENAREIEMDAVAHHGQILVSAIFEHVENVGVHSGDATLVLPPQRTFLETMRRVRTIGEEVARALSINGPFNVQFIAKHSEVKVIECNLRASRSLPFVSKVLDCNFADLATRVMLGHPYKVKERSPFDIDYVGVKAPQFSFTRLAGADPNLGVEMASTGEVACLGDDFEEAFLKALLCVGYRLPIRSVLLSTGNLAQKVHFLPACQALEQMGIELYSTGGTRDFLTQNGIQSRLLHWPLDERSPNAIEYIREKRIDLVINIPKSFHQHEITNGYLIRRAAADYSVNLITNLQLAARLIESLQRKSLSCLQIKSWNEYRKRLN